MATFRPSLPAALVICGRQAGLRLRAYRRPPRAACRAAEPDDAGAAAFSLLMPNIISGSASGTRCASHCKTADSALEGELGGTPAAQKARVLVSLCSEILAEVGTSARYAHSPPGAAQAGTKGCACPLPGRAAGASTHNNKTGKLTKVRNGGKNKI